MADIIVTEQSGGVTATFTLNLSSPSTVAIGGSFGVLAGTATAGADFTAASGNFTINPGQTSTTVNVAVLDDLLVEPIETFVLHITELSNATYTGTDTELWAIGEIGDDDTPLPLINVDDIVVDEGAGLAEFVVRLSAPSNEVVSVRYDTSNATAVANGDYNAVFSEILTFAPGEMVKTVQIALADDVSVEQDEVFYLNLSGATNAIIGRTEVTATIIDNDGATGTPILSVSDPVVDESIGEAVFTLSLDRPSTGTVTVDYTTAPDTADIQDYTPVSSTASFGPGEVVQTVRVPIVDDGLAEAIERFDLVLTNVSGATLPVDRGTATIDASDQAEALLPLINVDDLLVDEGAGFAEFVVRLSAPSSEEVSVRYDTSNATAVANGDYNAIFSEFLTFAAGETLKTVRIPIVDDLLVEPDETFLLNLSNAINATIGTDTVVATIRDNDGGAPAGVAIVPLADILLDEGGSISRTVTFTDGDDNGANGWTYEVDWESDGVVDESGIIAAGSNSFNIVQNYPDGPNSETVSVKVIDQAGVDEDTATFAVAVNNVVPVLTLSGAASVDEGSAYTLSMVSLTDPGDDTVSSYSINWGDGSAATVVNALGC